LDNGAKELFKLTDTTRARADAAEAKSNKSKVGFGLECCFHGDDNGYAHGLSSWSVPFKSVSRQRTMGRE